MYHTFEQLQLCEDSEILKTVLNSRDSIVLVRFFLHVHNFLNHLEVPKGLMHVYYT